MSGFRPTRASPPSKRAILGGHTAGPLVTSVSDISRSSAVSSSELRDLTPQDIEFLDAVIQRASSSATTFLTVFKAYNDVLSERGLDPQNEVTYYGKLLKLGTLKGKSWGDKWRMVKLQQGHTGAIEHQDTSEGPKNPHPPPARITTRLTSQCQEDDLFTLHSHQGDSEAATETEIDTHHSHHIPHPMLARFPSKPALAATNVLGLNNGPQSGYVAPPAARRQLLLGTTRTFRPWDDASDATEEVRTPSTTPPSYGAAVMDTQILNHAPRTRSHVSDRPQSAPGNSKPSPKSDPPRERRKSTINADDAWTKVKMMQDEKDADRFREDRLVERCWEVWKSGYNWILTTNEQISQARDTLLLRGSMERWRNQTASELELYSRVTTLADNRCLRAALANWISRLKEKRQMDWRNDMRTKMKTVREKREGKLRKDAWAKWRQSYRSHLSGQHYTERLILRFFRRWKSKLLAVDRLEAAGDKFLDVREGRAANRCWDYWRRAVELRSAERSVVERVSLRIIEDAMSVWVKHMHNNSIADAFHDHYLKKNVLRSWKTAQDRIQGLENRATKHLTRQNDVLVRAVARVWKARERGKLLERVRALRLIKDAWVIWHKRLGEQKQREDLALTFSVRSNTFTISSAFQTWRQVHASHRNALSFAIHYNSVQLRFKILLKWRLKLRLKLKMLKQGKSAEKFFTARRTWKVWTDKLEERRREKKLKNWEKQRIRKYFLVWRQLALHKRQRKQAEQEVQHRIAIRTMKTALSTWTHRVIELKLREIEVDQRNAIALQAFAFRKWKGVCIRHVEELSLMESYQDVKREENIRRMFHRWLSAARSARHRRVTLQQKEDEMKATCVAVAWDKWRERFVNEKLRPIEYDVILQTQRNTLFRAFGIWQSKTKSLPAIRFHASHSKAKHWQTWRAAMPQALQNRKAREREKRQVLSKALEKWLQSYRTKIALKAVARARYLRLPTMTPRLTNPAPRSSFIPVPTPSRPRRTPDIPEASPSQSTPIHSKPLSARTGIASLLSSRPRSETAASASRPKYTASATRDLSPTRTQSSVGPARGTSPVRQKYNPRSRSRGLLERDLTRPRPSYDAKKDKLDQDEDADESPSRPSRSRAPSSVGGNLSRTKLWLELREVQGKSKPPTERSGSPEPP